MRHGFATPLSLSLVLLAACGDNSEPFENEPDAMPDSPIVDGPPSNVCNPALALPTLYRPIPKVATTPLAVTTTAGVTSGTADATAGGFTMAAENPYIYLDLKNGVKVEVNDVEARSSMAWDIAFKRSSLRLNGGDGGPGNRKSAAVAATTLAEVTAGPADGYVSDDFTTADCKYVSLPAGEPMSAFGEWYFYEAQTSRVTPKAEVYVIQRPDGSRTAFRMTSYYDLTVTPARSAVYSVEWKQLPGAQ